MHFELNKHKLLKVYDMIKKMKSDLKWQMQPKHSIPNSKIAHVILMHAHPQILCAPPNFTLNPWRGLCTKFQPSI